jgi:general secretion pathway protein D
LRGTQLLREQYRLRAEDLQDSQYFRNNRRLLSLREAANTVIKARPELANAAPFAQFAGERVPGEATFVTGMMHRSLQRITKPETGLVQRLFFFERQSDGTQLPTTVGEALARYGDGSSAQSFFDKNPGKALALTFRFTRQSLDAADVFAEPVPQIQVLACANRIEWSRMLWQLNQPQGELAQHTILIQGPEDLDRLRLAIATKNTIFINGSERALLLNNWLPGRLLQLQATSTHWNRLLEASVARYFYLGEHAYSSFINQYETAQRDLAIALKRPDIAPLVHHINLP